MAISVLKARKKKKDAVSRLIQALTSCPTYLQSYVDILSPKGENDQHVHCKEF